MPDPNANLSARKTSAPLAIIGIGCLFPKADNLGAFWANIRDGVDAITEIPKTHWNPADYFDNDKTAPDKTYAQRGGFLNPYEFDPLAFGISPNNIEATDTTQLLGMVAAGRALLDAGYDEKTGKTFDHDRTSVILGVTGTLELVIPLGARLGHPLWRKALDEAGVDQQTADDVVQRIADGYVPWQENSFPGLLGNVAAGRIANRFDLGGTNCVVDAACASSLSAIHLASMELQAGRSDMVIAGGLDTFNDIFMYMCFSKTPAMSPTGNARPFSAGADGTILGEGLGVVILKRLDDAQRDEDHIYATIEGIGTSSDGRGNAIYAPSSQGQAKAIQDAYRQASVSPGDIELVEAHGTGTPAGDAVELQALTELYKQAGAPTDGCALGSIKSMIGHTKAAAGVAGLIKAAMALHTKVLPPTIKVDQPAESVLPHTSPLYVNTVKRPWVKRADAQPRRAAVSAFGFGGSNYHAVLGETPDAAKAIDWDGRVQLWTASGDSIAQLQAAVAKIDPAASWENFRAQAATSRESFDPAANCRLTLVIEQNKTDQTKLLDSVQKMFQGQPDADRWQTPDGAFFATGKPTGKVGVLFPGQGAQQVGMLRDLACQFPQILNMLEQGNEALGQTEPGQRLSDHIYPIPVFNAADQQQQDDALRDTQVAQPAMAAISLGVWRILEYFGLKADVTAGHSLGELVALCAAGRLSESEMFEAVCTRGRLMAQQKGGAMLAVAAEPKTLKPWLEKFEGLVLANHNSPTQVVLSGPNEVIDKVAVALKDEKFRVKKLAVSAAFHSPLVAKAAGPFAKALEKVAFTASSIAVYANTTAEVYPHGAEACRDLLANQLARPVQFATLLENLYKTGVRTFIELGPKRHVTGMVSATLAEQPHIALSLDRGNGQTDLARLLGELASLGYPMNLKKWDEGSPIPIDHAKRMTVTLSGANYVKPKPSRPPAPKKTLTPVSTQQTSTRSTVVTHSPPPAPRLPRHKRWPLLNRASLLCKNCRSKPLNCISNISKDNKPHSKRLNNSSVNKCNCLARVQSRQRQSPPHRLPRSPYPPWFPFLRSP